MGKKAYRIEKGASLSKYLFLVHFQEQKQSKLDKLFFRPVPREAGARRMDDNPIGELSMNQFYRGDKAIATSDFWKMEHPFTKEA
jgi:hypothetical protein